MSALWLILAFVFGICTGVYGWEIGTNYKAHREGPAWWETLISLVLFAATVVFTVLFSIGA